MTGDEEITSRRDRSRARLLFVAFVSAQLVVPASYYFRDDRYDERFAWRMFSAIRVESCESTASETIDGTLRPIDLDRSLHSAWLGHLRRNRLRVIERFTESRCDRTGAESVRVENRCVDSSGTTLPVRLFERRCATDLFTDSGASDGRSWHR